jgi:uncharacterized protein (TIGR02596 family)
MNLVATHLPGRLLRRGYTLIELLTVMAIMGILLVATLPSIEGLNRSANITQAGQFFADQVSLARQLSSARNITVEVRCIKVPSRSAKGYTALQLWGPGNTVPVTQVPLSRLQTLPDGIAISENTSTNSTLFGAYSSTGMMPTGTGSAAGDTYVSFTINPSGMVGPLTSSTVEPSMSMLSVCILPEGNATDAALPKNYMLVQLNPLTAATTSYRP